MECQECNQKKELRVNTEKHKFCSECWWSLCAVKTDEGELRNDVLFYVHENSGRAGYRVIVDSGASEYDIKDIKKAKDYLIAESIEELKKIDLQLANEVVKRRNNSNQRSLAQAYVIDIYNILDALGTNIKVGPKDMNNVPTINPEALLPKAVIQRIEALETVNKDLKQDLDDLKKQMATQSPTPSTDSDVAKSVATKTDQRHVKLTNSQKTQVSIFAANSAATAAAQAVQEGRTVQEATQIGNTAGKDGAKTFAQLLKNSIGNSAAAAASGGQALGHAQGTPAGSMTGAPWQPVKSKKSKLSTKAPYTVGNGSAMTIGSKSLTPARPEYLSNECLVVAGVSKELTENEFKQLINEKAEKEIDFRHIQVISSEYYDRLTVAIELNSEDYALLINPNFWDPRLRIRKFIGWRGWRGEKKVRQKPQENRNTVRASWASV